MFNFIFYAFILGVSINAYAVEVSTTINEGINALADYHEGDEDKPAVIILHGILQTKNFSTIKSISNHLVEEDYTVLAPTLSLGIDNRVESLSCEAIHTHSMESDIAEISTWIRWLKKRTNKPIILIGHSAGATQLIAYLDKYKGEIKQPAKVILISLAYFADQPNSHTSSESINKARKSLANKVIQPDKYGFTYCKEYVSTPEAYLSYIDWSRDKVTEKLLELDSSFSLLFGSADKRVDLSWPPELKEKGLDVTIVKDANHFFHAFHEFDLIDYIDGVLEKD
jgi:pimeloyl-ACP methyl ester carboxylesterase